MRSLIIRSRIEQLEPDNARHIRYVWMDSDDPEKCAEAERERSNLMAAGYDVVCVGWMGRSADASHERRKA